MRIHAVMGGYNGNSNIQYVELRMDTGGQTFLGGHTLQFYSGDPSVATNLKATFTFPAGVANGTTGDSILVATSEFNGAAVGGAADFTFIASGPNTNTVAANGGDASHPVQSPNGLVYWAPGNDNCDTDPFGAQPGEADSVGYGTTPVFFGSSAQALPNPPTNGVNRLNNLNLTPSNNSSEYGISTVSAYTYSVPAGSLPSDMTTPRNNARTVLVLPNTGPVGGVSQDPQLVPPGSATSDGGAFGWWFYLVGGVAATVAVLATAWWLRRRQVHHA